jgi:hypothetical protein
VKKSILILFFLTGCAYAGTAVNNPVFQGQAQSALNMGTNSITNLATPVNAADAATKNYVDTHGGGGAGTVTSVGMTVPSFLSVTPSSITTNGTFALSYSGTAIPVANGGTGTTSVAAAFQSFFETVATTLGDLVYGGTSGAPTRLAGSTSSSTAVLTQTGTGSASAAPAWSTTPAFSGSNVTSLNASALSSGTVPTAQLATGTASSTTYLRGDQTWAAVPQGTVTSVGLTAPSGFSVTGSPITGSGTLALSTSLSGVLKGTGTGLTASTDGTDYLSPLTGLSDHVITFTPSSAQWYRIYNETNTGGQISGLIRLSGLTASSVPWSTLLSFQASATGTSTITQLYCSSAHLVSIVRSTTNGSTNTAFDVYPSVGGYAIKAEVMALPLANPITSPAGGVASLGSELDFYINDDGLRTTSTLTQGSVLNSMIKANSGGDLVAATAGTDYLTPTGSGSGLTSLNASNLASGTVPAARMPALTGDVTTTAGSVATTVGQINGTSLAGLATGLLKNTTSTGVPSIAVAGTDYIGIVGSANLTGQTTALSSIVSVTPPALGTYVVQGYITPTSATSTNTGFRVTYNDETGASRTLTLTMASYSGVVGTGAGVTAPYAIIPFTFRAASSANIVVSSYFASGSTMTYDLGIVLTKIN